MNALVTLTIDGDPLLEPEAETLVIGQVADYPRACLAIRDALLFGKPVSLAVRHRAVAAWLTAYTEALPDGAVDVRRYSAREALSTLWQTLVPATVSDHDILESGLLDVLLSAREGQSFSDLVLEHFYGDHFQFRALPITHLGALIDAYDPIRWAEAARRPLVYRTFKERLGEWYDRAQNDSVRAVIDALRNDPEGLRRDLCSFGFLRRYPEDLGRKVLGPRWEQLLKARIEIEGLDLIPRDPRATIEIEYYLEGLRGRIGCADDVTALLEQMSGCLEEEFRFVESCLRTSPEWITTDLLRRVDLRFRPIRSRFGAALAALRRLVKPAFPDAPNSNWGASQWLEWVRDRYMPYYAWLEFQDERDDTAAGYAAQFADWFYENFILLKNGQPERFTFTALYRVRERISEGDAVSLALLMDNFNYVHFDELCRIFRAHGLLLMASEPVFSLIPTATEVGKAALIASNGDQIDVAEERYPALVEKEWGSRMPGKKTAYLPNIGALQQLSGLDHDLYFLNYLPIDNALHTDAQHTGRPHRELIIDYIETLGKSIAEFARRFQIENRLLIFVVPDHGATRIAKGVVNVLDKKFYNSVALEKHHRYVALSDDKFAALPQAAGEQCYLIDRQRFKTNHNYLAAKGYYRFLSTTDGFYVHGGLTPEEVVVPFAQFGFSAVTPSAPTVRLMSDQFRFAIKSRVVLEIGNPNGFPIDNVSIRLIDADSEEVILDRLGPKHQETVELATVFRKPIGGSTSRTVTVRVRYTYQDTEYAMPDLEFAVMMKAMMEVTDDFDL